MGSFRTWSAVQLELLRELVEADPGRGLAELAKLFSDRCGVEVTPRHVATLCERHGIARTRRPSGHGLPLLGDELQVLAGLLAAEPELGVTELVRRMTARTGRTWYRVTVCRARRRLGLAGVAPTQERP